MSAGAPYAPDKANLENIFKTDNTPNGILHKRKGSLVKKMVEFNSLPSPRLLHSCIFLWLLL